MKNKWLRKVVFSFLAVPLFLLSTARTLAIIDLGILGLTGKRGIGERSTTLIAVVCASFVKLVSLICRRTLS